MMELDDLKNWLRMAPVAGMVMAAAACGDDPTGPGSDDPFDPIQSSDDFAAVQTALAANADLADDIAYVSGSLETMPAATWVAATADALSGPSLVRPVDATLFSSSGGSAQPLLPADVLGTTFEWDEVENAYVATERAGAPASGVRFVLYDRTTSPLAENGFLDLTDESDPSADRLDVHLQKNGVTRLDYDIAVTETTSGASVSVAGYITDGAEQVDFDLVESVSETANGLQIDVAYTLSLESQPLSVDLLYSLDFGTAVSLDFTATFVNGADSLVFDLRQDGETIEGTVEWNGSLVMTVMTGEAGEPVFLGPDGEDLTPAEGQAIQEIFEMAFEGLDLLVAHVVFLGGSLD